MAHKVLIGSECGGCTELGIWLGMMVCSARLAQCLPGRLAKALKVPQLQQAVLDAVLCRLQLLPCWE